jgi:hypothetical protein
MRDAFNPLFRGELVFSVAGVERELGQVRLAKVVDVNIDHCNS